MDYYPDSWVAVLIETADGEKIHRILGSWYGGFANADTWRLSSGVKSVVIDKDRLIIGQESGSRYSVSARQHSTPLIESVMNRLTASAAEHNCKISRISTEELIAAFTKDGHDGT